MILRVKELEGWAGLYKGELGHVLAPPLPASSLSLTRHLPAHACECNPGIYPYILSHTLSFSILIIFLGASTSLLPSGTPQVPNPSGLRTAMVAMVVTFVSLPLLIITNRCVITPSVVSIRSDPS